MWTLEASAKRMVPSKACETKSFICRKVWTRSSYDLKGVLGEGCLARERAWSAERVKKEAKAAWRAS